MTFNHVYSGNIINPPRGLISVSTAYSRYTLTNTQRSSLTWPGTVWVVLASSTLCIHDHTVILEKMDSQEPVTDVVVKPNTKAYQQKMSKAQIKFAAKDLVFRFSCDGETGPIITEETDELHPKIIVDYMM